MHDFYSTCKAISIPETLASDPCMDSTQRASTNFKGTIICRVAAQQGVKSLLINLFSCVGHVSLVDPFQS